MFLSYRSACVTVLRLEGSPAAGLRRKQNEPSFFGVPCSAGNDLIGAGEISVIYYWILAAAHAWLKGKRRGFQEI